MNKALTLSFTVIILTILYQIILTFIFMDWFWFLSVGVNVRTLVVMAWVGIITISAVTIT